MNRSINLFGVKYDQRHLDGSAVMALLNRIREEVQAIILLFLSYSLSSQNLSWFCCLIAMLRWCFGFFPIFTSFLAIALFISPRHRSILISLFSVFCPPPSALRSRSFRFLAGVRSFPSTATVQAAAAGNKRFLRPTITKTESICKLFSPLDFSHLHISFKASFKYPIYPDAFSKQILIQYYYNLVRIVNRTSVRCSLPILDINYPYPGYKPEWQSLGKMHLNIKWHPI